MLICLRKAVYATIFANPDVQVFANFCDFRPRLKAFRRLYKLLSVKHFVCKASNVLPKVSKTQKTLMPQFQCGTGLKLIYHQSSRAACLECVSKIPEYAISGVAAPFLRHKARLSAAKPLGFFLELTQNPLELANCSACDTL